MEEKKQFDFKLFIEESKQTLVNPKEHFSQLKVSGGLGEPIIKALIYGVVGGILAMLWALLHLSGVGGMFMGGGAIGTLFFTIIGAVIGLFIGGLIIMLLSLICGGNSDYEANVRVTSSLMVLLPVSMLLNIFGFLGFWISALIGLAVNLYGLYLLYLALTLTLKGKDQSAKVIGYVLGGLLVLSLLMGACTRGVAHRVSNKSMHRYEKKLKKWADALEDEVADYAKEHEKLQKEIAKKEQLKEMSEFTRPESFPKKGANEVNDLFKEGDARLSPKTIKKLTETIEDLKKVDRTNMDEVLASLERNGYNNLEDYKNDYVFVATCFEAIKQISSLDDFLTTSDIDLKTGEGVAVLVMAKIPIEQTIAAGNLTLEDVKVAYKNWDELDELMKLSAN